LSASLDKITPLPRRPAAAERVAAQLQELIRSGNLKAGDVMPSENELARALQVSRPVIREALRGLQILGLVETRQGGRCSVTDLSVARLFQPFQVAMTLNENNIEQLYQARVAVECELTRRAASTVEDEALARLREMVSAGYAMAEDPVGFRVVDFEFHQALMALGDNPFLEVMAKGLYELGMEYRRVASESPGVIERSAAEHETIVAALATRSAERAAEAMRRHLESIGRTTREAMRRLAEASDAAARAVEGASS
jgi:GntR family transcriptional regulator, transcriptional repressor for pyruvate dehydrogenase complex